MEVNKRSISNAVLMPEIRKLISERHTVTLPLKGNSMRPYLVHMRDKALLEKATELNVGDVILAEVSPQHYVLHRLVGISRHNDNEPLTLTLRGDGNYATETCTSDNVIAKATAFYRKGRDKAERTDSLKYKLYSSFWMRTLMFRRYFLKLHDILFHSLKNLNQ